MATVYPIAKPPLDIVPRDGVFTPQEVEALVEGPFTLLPVNSKLVAVCHQDFAKGTLRPNKPVTKLLRSSVTLTGVTILASPEEVQALWPA
jgi:hypothetical protein